MYRQPSKKKEIIRRTLIYAAMVVSIVVIVTIFIFLLLGYRIDSVNGKIEQGALIQFASVPSGAGVTIDGKSLGSNTSTKSTVLAGTHTFVMQRSGYETWQKTLDITSGTLTWLNYARLVPENRPVKAVATYPTVYNSLAAPDGNTMLVQQSESVPTFQIVDLSSDTIKTSTITIPATDYSDATTAGVTHAFSITQWDPDGRYLLVEHTYGNQREWLVVDTQNVDNTKNITSLLALDMSKVVFSGTNGQILYALTGTDIRKIDLSAGTISLALVQDVSSFDLFQTNVITYVGTDPTNATNSVVGIYREGDTSSQILRSVPTIDGPLHITTTSYFNQNYVAISQGDKVDITDGSYPSPGSNNKSLSKFASFTFAANVDTISFSPEGAFLLVQSGSQFASYDIEREVLNNYSVKPGTGVIVAPVQWLDPNHTWSDYGGNLIMRDFDGGNAITINQDVSGQDATLTQNGKYIYSIGKTKTGYQLQRVLMILS